MKTDVTASRVGGFNHTFLQDTSGHVLQSPDHSLALTFIFSNESGTTPTHLFSSPEALETLSAHTLVKATRLISRHQLSQRLSRTSADPGARRAAASVGRTKFYQIHGWACRLHRNPLSSSANIKVNSQESVAQTENEE